MFGVRLSQRSTKKGFNLFSFKRVLSKRSVRSITLLLGIAVPASLSVPHGFQWAPPLLGADGFAVPMHLSRAVQERSQSCGSGNVGTGGPALRPPHSESWKVGTGSGGRGWGGPRREPSDSGSAPGSGTGAPPLRSCPYPADDWRSCGKSQDGGPTQAQGESHCPRRHCSLQRLGCDTIQGKPWFQFPLSVGTRKSGCCLKS